MANIQIVSENETLEKRHRTACTSREAFRELTNEGTLIIQKKKVYEAIRDSGPATSRQLAAITRQERSSVCRSLFDLLNEINPAIMVCFIKPCPITGRRVKWYGLTEKQLKLFQAI